MLAVQHFHIAGSVDRDGTICATRLDGGADDRAAAARYRIIDEADIERAADRGPADEAKPAAECDNLADARDCDTAVVPGHELGAAEEPHTAIGSARSDDFGAARVDACVARDSALEDSYDAAAIDDGRDSEATRRDELGGAFEHRAAADQAAAECCRDAGAAGRNGLQAVGADSRADIGSAGKNIDIAVDNGGADRRAADIFDIACAAGVDSGPAVEAAR